MFHLDFRQVLDDSPENREVMFQHMLRYDEPFAQAPAGLQYGAPKRQGLPFFLGVTMCNSKIAFMTGPDAMTSFRFVIAEWTPWKGLVRVDLPIHEIRWVNHL